jgi:predicted dehydrogenase
MSGPRRGWAGAVPGSPLRAAVVGAGLMGRWHARELVRAGGELVAVADRDRAAASAVGGDRAVADLAAALARSPDVVHICTPLDGHDAIATRCLAAGAHVLCEKPLAPDAAATERLLALAGERGLLLCPTHQFLFQPGFVRAARAVAGGGPLLHADAIAVSAGGEGRPTGKLDEVAAEIVPHALAAFERLLPGGVAGASWDVHRPRPGELRATTTAGRATASLLVSLGGRPPVNELRLTAAHATATVDLFHGFAVVEGGGGSGGSSRAAKAARPFALAGATAGAAAANLAGRAARAQPAYPGLRELVGALYAAIRSGGPSPIAPGETLAVARARDALIAAQMGASA